MAGQVARCYILRHNSSNAALSCAALRPLRHRLDLAELWDRSVWVAVALVVRRVHRAQKLRVVRPVRVRLSDKAALPRVARLCKALALDGEPLALRRDAVHAAEREQPQPCDDRRQDQRENACSPTS